MCLILSLEESISNNLFNVLQVIESIKYCQSKRKVDITLDLLISNQDSPKKLNIFHRGFVNNNKTSSNLLTHSCSTNFDNGDRKHIESDDLLDAIYQSRIDKVNHSFFERKNCFNVNKIATPVDNYIQSDFIFDREIIAENDTEPPFTSFYIKDIPTGTSWFRTKFSLSGTTYKNLVESVPKFWIDGPQRVAEQIAYEQLPFHGYMMPNPKENTDFFFNAISPQHLLHAKAYDIVLFLPGTKDVDSSISCNPGNSNIFEAPIANSAVAKRSRLFVSREPDFLLYAWYKRDKRIINSTTTCKNYLSSIINF